MSDQPPMQQEDTSRFKMLLTKFIEQTEIRNNNLEASIQILTSQVEQFANIINNWSQTTLPSHEEMNPKEEGEEQYEADTLENGMVFHEAVRRNLKRSHLDAEEESGFDNKRSRIEKEEKKDEDVRAMNTTRINKISPVPDRVNSTKYIRIDLGEGKIPNMDEFKFGGGLQSCTHAGHIKEKTKRRHEKTIFAIEPD